MTLLTAASLMLLIMISSLLVCMSMTASVHSLRIMQPINNNSDPYCCLPNVCSMTSSSSFIRLSSSSSSILMKTIKEFYDFTNQRKRSEEFMNITVEEDRIKKSDQVVISSITLLVKDTFFDYTYLLGNSTSSPSSKECHCRRTPNNRKLEQCFGMPGFKIEKTKILNLDATKLSLGEPQSGFYYEDWVVQEGSQGSDSTQCWHLSRMQVDPNSVQKYDYYDMSEKLDSKLFEIPSWCPPKENCQIFN
ncbi:hypothetical protein C9374_000069 [Naegleria lovaniensis]|uniref:Uncharacterized protein n=1 Tax=Naegleria lovaniensis TaxID=51637 RepID=A0AA88KM69_NAELO|nr:uncharacterized protein C9374_000069 [Naegleria lovaniensis]KAG2388630.1 hypothetical protein C9374_000069 [Naegleria lovaniensis]